MYHRYKDLHEQAANSREEVKGNSFEDNNEQASRSSRASSSNQSSYIKNDREQAFYREMFIQLLDILDAITGQMFEGV